MKKLWVFSLLMVVAGQTFAQVDTEHRRRLTLQTSIAVHDSEESLGGAGYYWFNDDHFPWTNTALRLIYAGVYAEGELSYFLPAHTNTAIGFGLGGGVYADNMTPYVDGERLASQEFDGDNVNAHIFINQTIPNPTPLPLNVRATYGASYSLYRDANSPQTFTLPSDFLTHTILGELRFGGIEPGLTAKRGLVLYIAADANYRSGFHAFGPNAALFPEHKQYERVYGTLGGKLPFGKTMVGLRIHGGAGEDLDELSAFKLGGNLFGVDQYSYTMHGYYIREFFAKDFGLVNFELAQQITESHELTLHLYGDYAKAKTVAPQDGQWHDYSGVGTGVSFRTFWDIDVLISYGYGFDALRNGKRGGHEIGLAFEKNF